MSIEMASATQLRLGIPMLTVSQLHHKRIKLLKYHCLLQRSNLSRLNRTLRYSKTSPSWEPAPVTYAPESEEKLLPETSNLFETMHSSGEPEQQVEANNKTFTQLQYLRKPLWVLGPALLLVTGVVPTLWLPISSIFLGPNIASILSLTGLDCIFNLGASLFLLMADSTARSDNTTGSCNSKPPSSYQFWNTVANITGFIVPLALFLGSQKGFLQPQFPFIPFAVLLGPYFLLLSIQILTEMLTWHWQSPVWLVTPVIYEAYRLLQLMRALKLGPEFTTPGWMMHGIRGLVCGWVVVLGVQLMRVAWYAGFTARAYRQQSGDAPADTATATAS